jgi:hypothetical protein
MGGIESRQQTEKMPLLPKAESNPSTPTSDGVAHGNLAPTVQTIPQHGSQVPSLEPPRLLIDTDGSIKLVLPKKIAADERLAKQLSEAIFLLFFFPSAALPVRDPTVDGLDNLHAGRGSEYKKTNAAIGFLNGFIELLESCGVPSQDFLSAALKVDKDHQPPTLEVFLSDYLGLNAKVEESEEQKITSQCSIIKPNFHFVFKNLAAIIESTVVTSLGVGQISKIVANIYDSTVGEDAPKLWKISHEVKESTLRSYEILVLYLVLRHQQSWLGKSPDLDHLEMAAKATVLLSNIARSGMNAVPAPPDPSDLIAKLADRAVEAVAEENLPDAEHCAEILANLTKVSEHASVRLADVRAVIAEYDAQAEVVAAEGKVDG